MKYILSICFLFISFWGYSQTDTVIDVSLMPNGSSLVIDESMAFAIDDTMRYWFRMPSKLFYWGFHSHVDTNLNDTIHVNYYSSPVALDGYQVAFPSIVSDTLIGVADRNNANVGWHIMNNEYFMVELIKESTRGKFQGYLFFSRP